MYYDGVKNLAFAFTSASLFLTDVSARLLLHTPPRFRAHTPHGFPWNINEAASLDLYGRDFWTRQEGDSVRLSTGENLRFKDADSSRLRFGGRFAYTVNEHVAPYIGAVWEHEFNGTARATTNGFDINAPNLRGGTGMGELGLTLTPSADLPLTIDLGGQARRRDRELATEIRI